MCFTVCKQRPVQAGCRWYLSVSENSSLILCVYFSPGQGNLFLKSLCKHFHLDLLYYCRCITYIFIYSAFLRCVVDGYNVDVG